MSMRWNDDILVRGPTPLWFQIAERLRASITAGEFRPGDALPSEAEINAAFKVSRTTARASLDRLRQEGLIFRQSGRGSIVLKPKVEQPVNQLASFSEDMRRRGLKASYTTFSAAPTAASVEAAEALGVDSDASVFFIRRLLLANDEPMGMMESWLAPSALGENAAPTAEELDAGSLYRWLSNRCGIQIAGAKEFIEAAVADATMSRRLDIAPGAAVLVARRRSHAADGAPIEYAVMHYRADRYRFIIDLGSQ
jgi:GntR family transcriptional regulator